MDVVMTSMTPLAPATTQQQPAIPPVRTTDSHDLRTSAVYVVYTSTDDTLAALRIAGGFAKALNVPLILIHYRAVPYPLAVDHPTGVSPIHSAHFLERLHIEEIDVVSRVYLCRDDRRAIGTALNTPSLVVVGGGRRRWWPTKAERWRRALETAGHYVIFVEEHSHA
jgi:hypothetical protein